MLLEIGLKAAIPLSTYYRVLISMLYFNPFFHYIGNIE